jgi:hypothetical protein
MADVNANRDAVAQALMEPRHYDLSVGWVGGDGQPAPSAPQYSPPPQQAAPQPAPAQAARPSTDELLYKYFGSQGIPLPQNRGASGVVSPFSLTPQQQAALAGYDAESGGSIPQGVPTGGLAPQQQPWNPAYYAAGGASPSVARTGGTHYDLSAGWVSDFAGGGSNPPGSGPPQQVPIQGGNYDMGGSGGGSPEYGPGGPTPYQPGQSYGPGYFDNTFGSVANSGGTSFQPYQGNPFYMPQPMQGQTPYQDYFGGGGGFGSSGFGPYGGSSYSGQPGYGLGIGSIGSTGVGDAYGTSGGGPMYGYGGLTGWDGGYTLDAGVGGGY